ncbi:MAG: OmpA family protein [Pyrinomonadaceae bacterium]|nr:OmpA family protein [Pyrinomonadaceae bacterium]
MRQTFINTQGTDVQRNPGSTSLSFSTDILLELRQKGVAQVRAARPEDEVGIRDNALSGVLAAVQAMAGTPDQTEIELIPWTLRRVGQVAFPVILNGERKMLAALHVTATAEGATAHRWILDDPDFPLRLAVSNSSGTSYQVITINVPQAAQQVPKLEQQITQQGRADIHGIYFDFNSAEIRPESTPTLKEIATVLERNPSWKLSVEGHTDNIGQDDDNLELSKKRAAAVTTALVARFKITAERLTTKGWGASKSVESNTTTEGRAKNRRVELVRL